jgi:type IV secretory pathway VirD2 relaxase
MFSMPPGTRPEKVLSAVQNFCREEFALKHRYVMALHTDEPHPHAHVIVKSIGDDGRRLNIKKATLREWRVKFAAHLRELGVAANATPRRFRGQSLSPTPLSIIWLRNSECEISRMARDGRNNQTAIQSHARVRWSKSVTRCDVVSAVPPVA